MAQAFFDTSEARWEGCSSTRSRRLLSGDAGLSMAEMLVVLVLLGVVLGCVYGIQSAISRSVRTTEVLAAGSKTIGDPLEFMSRVIMQARAVAHDGGITAPNGQLVALPSSVATQPDGFHLVVATDRVPFNGWWELNYFHVAPSNPSTLVWDCWTYTDTNNDVGSRRQSWTMSTSVNNRTVGLPMLDYYGSDAAVSLPDPASIASDLKYVKVSLAVPSAGGGWTKDSRLVNLRN